MMMRDEYYGQINDIRKREADRERRKKRKADREAEEAARELRFARPPKAISETPSAAASADAGVHAVSLATDHSLTNADAEKAATGEDNSRARASVRSVTVVTDETPTEFVAPFSVSNDVCVEPRPVPMDQTRTIPTDHSPTMPCAKSPTPLEETKATYPCWDSLPTQVVDQTLTPPAATTPTHTEDDTRPRRARKSLERDRRALAFLKELEGRAADLPVDPTRPHPRRWIKMSEAAYRWASGRTLGMKFRQIPRFPPWRDATDLLRATFYHRSILAEYPMSFALELSQKLSDQAFVSDRGFMFVVRETLSRNLRRACGEAVEFWFAVELGAEPSEPVLRGAIAAAPSQAAVVRRALEKLAHAGSVSLNPIPFDPFSLSHDDEWPQRATANLELTRANIEGDPLAVSLGLLQTARTLYSHSSPILYFDS